MDGGTHSYLGANVLAGSDRMELYVDGNDGQLLGFVEVRQSRQGRFGAAVQNMNISLGLDETVFLRGV